MNCVICNERPAIQTGRIETSWDTCILCTGLAIKNLEQQSKQSKLVPVIIEFDLMIGKLDRGLSEFLHACEDPLLDAVNAHTLKHHADDLIGVGTHALKKLADRGET
jgi:hypothetical protein